MSVFNRDREELIAKASRDHFSNNITLSKKELAAEAKLSKLRLKMLEKRPMCALGNFYDNREFLLGSDLYKLLNLLPKPGVHHIHLTAACDVKFIVNTILTQNMIYFNQKAQMFKVYSQDKKPDPGYI